MLGWFTWAMSVAALVLFILGHVFFFKATPDPHPLIRALKFGALASMVLQWYGLWPTRQAAGAYLPMAAILCEAIAMAIFAVNIKLNRRRRFEQAFNKKEPHTLYQDGLYRYVRHPFYTAYMTAYVGGVLGSGGSLVLVGQTLLMIILYHKAARMEEQKFSSSAFREDYANYRRNTGMFFPRILGAAKKTMLDTNA